MKRTARRLIPLLFLAGVPFGGYSLEYSVQPTLSFRGGGDYLKDSLATIRSDLRGRAVFFWQADLRARHEVRTSGLSLFVDHDARISTRDEQEFLSTNYIVSVPGTGLAGSGTRYVADQPVRFAFYQLYADLTSDSSSAVIRVGRQRFLWGPEPLTPMVDTIHPQETEEEYQSGFDGLRIGFQGQTLHLNALFAMQEAISRGNLRYTRIALTGEVIGTRTAFGLAAHYSYATSLRGIAHLWRQAGPIKVFAISGIEFFEPRRQVVQPQGLWGAGLEIAQKSARWAWLVRAHYFYNGLAEEFVDENTAEAITVDAAGGFQRPGIHYWNARVAIERVGAWRIENEASGNAGDLSALVRHTIHRLIGSHATVYGRVSWNWGDIDSEFGGGASLVRAECGLTLSW